jgi:leader peptidase (prepilin peptidase)/N-methyltransferase
VLVTAGYTILIANKSLNTFFECVLFVLGLAFGSFLNVCITRIPRDESVLRPRSHCRACGKPVRWRDNIPVLSFLLLRGRCRDCRALIPYRYPAVELLTAVVFAACYAWFGPTWVTVKFCVFGFLLVGLIFMDAETGLLPHEFTYPGIVIGLVFSWLVPGDSSGTWLLLLIFHQHVESVRWLSLLDAFVAALFGASFFYFSWALYYLARKRHGLGFGDIALIAMTGAFLGLKLNLLVIIAGPIVTLLYVLLLLVREAFRPRRNANRPEQAQASRSGDDGVLVRDQVQTASRRVAAMSATAPLAGDKASERFLVQAPEGAEVEGDRSEADIDATLENAPLLQRELPFGVFLGASALATIFFGQVVWLWYLARFR